MPVFTSIGVALGATVAASAGAGIGAFGVGVLATAAAAGGIAASGIGSRGQQVAARNANQDQLKAQEKLLAEAKGKAVSEESTATQTAARAKQRSLAQAAGAQGRRSTIKTSAIGVPGPSAGNIKQLIGE